MKIFSKNEYVIWIEFEDNITNFFNEKCGVLEQYKIKPGIMPPHMTLTFIKTKNIDKFIEYTKSFFKENSVSINLQSVDMFKSRVVYYAPEKSSELLNFQRSFCRGLSEIGKLSWKLYFPENWTPHIALTGSLNKTDSIKALSIMRDGFSPIENVKIKRIIIKNCYSGEIVLNIHN